MRAWLSALSSFGGIVWCASALAQYAPPPAGSAPAATPAPAPDSSSTLSAGGLAPPPAVEAPPPPGAETPAATEAKLERADREDSGRGLEFVWLNAEAGVTHVGLATFHDNHLLDPNDVRPKETGFVAGAGAGVKLIFLTLGARFRYAPMPDYKLWSLGLEGGVHFPLGSFEPYATLDVGYVSLGSFPGFSSIIKVNGFDARLAAGADYYLTNLFSIGVNVSADLLLLQRTNAVCVTPLGASGSGINNYYCGGSGGSSTGGAVSATAVGGLHF
jgi:hypothetical protein